MIPKLGLDWTEDVVTLDPVGPNGRVELWNVGSLWRPCQESAVGPRGLVVTLLRLGLKAGAVLQTGNKVVRLFLGGGPGRICQFKVTRSIRIIFRTEENVADLHLFNILLRNGRCDVADLTLLHGTSKQLRGDLVAEGNLQRELFGHALVQSTINPGITDLLLKVWIKFRCLVLL